MGNRAAQVTVVMGKLLRLVLPQIIELPGQAEDVKSPKQPEIPGTIDPTH